MAEAIETIHRTGRRITWDTTNADEVRDFLGSHFGGIWEDLVIFKRADSITYVQPGWLFIRWDNDEMTVQTRHAANVTTRVVT